MPTMGSSSRRALGDAATACSPRRRRTRAPAGTRWRPGAWPGVHGSTNNTFHINGQPFGNRTAAFDPNVLQVETIAQSAERGGLKVAQVEWAGGRNATIQGPTIDFQSFFSGRGVATNFIGVGRRAAVRRRAVHHELRAPVRPSGRVRRTRPPFPGAAPDAGRRLDRRPCRRLQPGEGDAPARPRWHPGGRQVRPQRLHLRQHQRRHDELRQGPVLADARTRSARSATLAKGQWADVKVKIQGGALDGKTAGMLVKVEELTADLSRVRLFHTSVSRAIATLADVGG